jgi:3-isopropylmalate/(R)-2-methylmalate dehydratase small subunit
MRTPTDGHRGTAAPLRRRSVDTDQIIPAEFCKRLGRTGYDDALFHRWRKDPSFVLNQEAYAGASVLVAAPDFGIGSSREHAVWALRDFGFRAVVASGFGDIFRINSGKNELITADVAARDAARLQDMVEADPRVVVHVDLVTRTVSAGDLRFPFTIDDRVRYQLMEGLDDISVTLGRAAAIDRYEQDRPSWFPRVAS